MSVQAVNLLLGVGRLYVKRSTDADGKYRLAGSIKAKGQFMYKKTEVEQRPSDVIVFVRRDKIEETATLKLEIVDFRMDQLIAALGQSGSTTQLTLTSSVRVAQELTSPASTTSTRSLSTTPRSATSVAFTSLDRATDYARGTDWTSPTAKKYRPLSAAFKGKAVRAYYTKKSTTAYYRLNIGDNETLQQISVKYVHKQSNGKHIQFEFPLATVVGDLNLDFKEREYTTYELTIAALGDPTKAKGSKLCSVVREI